ncbi:MAG: hypothetical protein ACI8TL_001442, partial [Natronomonas sp.]
EGHIAVTHGRLFGSDWSIFTMAILASGRVSPGIDLLGVTRDADRLTSIGDGPN